MKNGTGNNKLFAASIAVSVLLISDIILSSINLYRLSKKIKILKKCEEINSELMNRMDAEAEANAKAKEAAENEETKEESN